MRLLIPPQLHAHCRQSAPRGLQSTLHSLTRPPPPQPVHCRLTGLSPFFPDRTEKLIQYCFRVQTVVTVSLHKSHNNEVEDFIATPSILNSLPP
ncbi:hypothetical protein J6590_003397 [Homalodisca vitripennis]|nr:hypothetical protein J6590_003397 [Homalodisca vitripennis]